MTILVASMASFFLKGYQERSRAIRLEKQGFVSGPELLHAIILTLLTGDATPPSYIRPPVRPRSCHGQTP